MNDLLSEVLKELIMGDFHDAANLIRTGIALANPITKYIQFMQSNFGLLGYIFAWPILGAVIYLTIWLIHQIWLLIKYWSSQ